MVSTPRHASLFLMRLYLFAIFAKETLGLQYMLQVQFPIMSNYLMTELNDDMTTFNLAQGTHQDNALDEAVPITISTPFPLQTMFYH